MIIVKTKNGDRFINDKAVTVVEHDRENTEVNAEQLAEMQAENEEPLEEEWGDEYRCRRCVKFKLSKDHVYYHANMAVGEMKESGGTPLMHACAKAFTEFRQEHPEVTEIHFFTDQELE